MITQEGTAIGAEPFAEALAQVLGRLKSGNAVSAIGEFVLELLKSSRIDLPKGCLEKIWASFHDAAARNHLVDSGIYLKVRDGLQVKERGVVPL